MTQRQKVFRAIALFLAFSLLQLYVQVSLAGQGLGGNSAAVLPQRQIVAKLTTRGNQPITVNGASTNSGSTVLTGATIETPDGVGATVDLGPLGKLDLAPNTSVQLDFSDGNVKVKLIKGCAILRTKKNTDGEIDTDQGSAGKTDKKTGGVLDFCIPPGGGSPVAGQAANAGAGAAAGGAAAGGGAAGGGLFGLGEAATIAIVGGGIGALVAIPLLVNNGRGSNPSPAS